MSSMSHSSSWYRRYYQSISPMIKDHRTQAYTMVVLSLLTMSFFGFFAIRPTLKTIAVLQKQIEDRSFVDKKLEEKINSLIEAQDEYHRVEPLIPAIYSFLPEKPDLTSLLIKLEDLISSGSAAISNVSFDSLVLYGVQSGAPEPVKNPQAQTDVLGDTVISATPFAFSITFSGSYRDLVSVLSRLTKLDRVVTIDSAGFQVAAAASGSSQLTVDLHSNGYYFPLE